MDVGGKKEKKHFNLLAVNMPTAAGARTLSLEGGGYREEVWNYYKSEGDSE